VGTLDLLYRDPATGRAGGGGLESDPVTGEDETAERAARYAQLRASTDVPCAPRSPSPDHRARALAARPRPRGRVAADESG
jgi:hypothetical protein